MCGDPSEPVRLIKPIKRSLTRQNPSPTGDLQWINNELINICSGEVITEKELRTTRLNNLDDYDIEGLDFQLNQLCNFSTMSLCKSHWLYYCGVEQICTSKVGKWRH